jgi:5'(3')-deoxyribonucleotidase|tara:strand:- start:314 stop:763 length:450 start_codon:yes stop_codon:yes gene_type:complete
MDMKKILYIDMDNVLVDFQSGIDKTNEDVRAEYAGRLDEVPGIFSLMEPVTGAITAFTELSKKFDTYILSTSPWENPSAWSDKLIWVKKYLTDYAYKRLILSHHKNLNSGHFLVDDRKKNGADKFHGELIHFATPQFPDWKAVTDYLMA